MRGMHRGTARARDLSHLARFAEHVLVSVLALNNLGERSLSARRSTNDRLLSLVGAPTRTFR